VAKVKASDLKEHDPRPTTIPGIMNDPHGRVTAGTTKEGEMVYIYDKKEILSDRDGFDLLTGKAPVPLCKDLVSTFSHIPRERWDAIFGRKD